jgi:Zn-dependent protease with chaperone function
MTSPDLRSSGTIHVERWPSELPLLALCLVASVAIYVLLVISVIGIFYVAAFGVLFFVMNAAFVAHIRGSAVRLGPQQFPDLHRRVEEIARRIGLDDVPDAYLMQAGGALNAFATRFLGLNVIVLYSHLLEACGDNAAARDMIIAHELGHIKAGHTRLRWLIAPASAIPFLGSALSQAREYTCDRYGLAGAGEKSGALLGLTILAAGGTHAPLVNQQALALQREDLDTGWLTIGSWLGGHPPLSKRLAALEPALLAGLRPSWTGRIRALAIVGAVGVVIVAGIVWGALLLPKWLKQVEREGQQRRQQQQAPYRQPLPDTVLTLRAEPRAPRAGSGG